MSNTSFNTTTIRTATPLTASFDENRIKFWILLFFQILSIPCSLYVLYHFIHNRQLRQSYHHHVIFLLLIISFLFVIIALPFTQVYMYTSYVYPKNEIFCSIWNFLQYSLHNINLFLMAFATIEKNWLLFHPSFLRNQKRKFCFHYLPLLLCLIYPPIFYIGAIFIYDCRMRYNYTQLLCKWPCFFSNDYLSNIDLFFNNNTPLILIPIFCILIYLRFFRQKYSMRQQIFKWRRDKKLIIQLLAISILYLSMWIPLQVLTLINLYWNVKFLVQEKIDYFYLFPYLIHLIYPFIVLFTFRNQMINFKRHRTIQPINT